MSDPPLDEYETAPPVDPYVGVYEGVITGTYWVTTLVEQEQEHSPSQSQVQFSEQLQEEVALASGSGSFTGEGFL